MRNDAKRLVKLEIFEGLTGAVGMMRKGILELI